MHWNIDHFTNAQSKTKQVAKECMYLYHLCLSNCLRAHTNIAQEYTFISSAAASRRRRPRAACASPRPHPRPPHPPASAVAPWRATTSLTSRSCRPWRTRPTACASAPSREPQLHCCSSATIMERKDPDTNGQIQALPWIRCMTLCKSPWFSLSHFSNL